MPGAFLRRRELSSRARGESGRVAKKGLPKQLADNSLLRSLLGLLLRLLSRRVKEVHLRSEVELGSGLLKDERARCDALRRELEELKDERDATRAAKNLEGIPGVDPVDILDEFVDVAVKMEGKVGELEGKIAKYKRDGVETSDDEEAAPNGNLNNPHTLEGVEVARLEAKVETLEARAKNLEDEVVDAKEEHTRRLNDAGQILQEAKESARRQKSQLERRLAAARAEGDTARTELEAMRLERNKIDEYVRGLNFELESVKLQLSQTQKEAKLGPRPEPKPDVDGELTRLQSLLDERTAAAAVLMQTIESLQQGMGIASVVEDSYVSDGDESLDATEVSKPASFQHHTLAKRVVALTSELSSAHAVAAMMERRAEQLSLEVGQRNELVGYLEDRVKLLEEENEKHGFRAAAVSAEHSRMTANFNREVAKIEGENAALRRELLKCEVKVRDGEVETAALGADIGVLEDIVYNLRVKVKEMKDVPQQVEPPKPTEEEERGHFAVIEIVESFIHQLQQMRSASGNRRSRAQDDQIFAYVTSLVTKTATLHEAASTRASSLMVELRAALSERDSTKMDLVVSREEVSVSM